MFILIFSLITQKNLVLTAIDKFSKYAIVKLIKSRSAEDIKEPLREVLMYFGVPESIVIDNEKALNSQSILFMLEDQMNIKVHRTLPDHSTSNGKIERFDSTLAEIMRCLNTERLYNTFEELLKQPVMKYYYSIHSTMNQKPAITFFGRLVSNDPLNYEKIFGKINKRYGTKLTNKYKTEIVKEDKNTTVLTDSGRIIYRGLIILDLLKDEIN